ncbi:MAG: LLM class flavin-dependent oxidoreductase [Betaproteobacteria bacterium]|nr:LLM class flavin-dependent oxidoreductase [Betaproteobacteria bacterium]
MRFGFMFFARDLVQSVGSTARLAEAHGYDLLGIGDSPSLAHDPFLALAIAAQNTSRIRLGTTVTNPQTRHPLILANCAASVAQLAPDRAFLGLGIGNSGVRHALSPPATLATLESTVGTVRELLAGGAVAGGGSKMRVHGGGVRMPILIAGSGPQSLRLAGRVADAVFINLGFTPEVLADGVRWVREGAKAAGRDPAAIETWAFGIGAIAPTREQALDEAIGPALAIAAYILRGDPAAKRIPAAVAEKVGQLLREYEYGEHLTPGHTSNYRLALKLGISDYLLERFAIAGTAQDCKARIAAVREAGIENLCLSFTASPDLARYVRGFGEAVLPAFRPPTA